MLYQLGRYQEALAAYERGIYGHKLAIELWEGKAKTLRALGRIKKAETAEQEAQRLAQRRAAILKKEPVW